MRHDASAALYGGPPPRRTTRLGPRFRTGSGRANAVTAATAVTIFILQWDSGDGSAIVTVTIVVTAVTSVGSLFIGGGTVTAGDFF
jgi:hypothetical protein